MAGLIRATIALAVAGALAACERPVILSGERLPVRGADAPAAPANRSVPPGLPAPVANGDWPQRAGGPTHAMPHLALNPGAERLWSVPIGTGNGRRTRITAAPVVAGGVVFAMDALSQVVAVSTAGQVLWRTDAILPGETPGTASGGGLAVAGGRLYVTTGFGEALALDAGTGAVIWRHNFGAPVSAAPTVSDGTVYVMARGAGGYALDAADGKVRWIVPGVPQTAGRANAPSPAVAGDLVYFPFAAGEVIAVNRRDGTPAWAAQAAGARLGRAAALLADLTGDPVVAGGTLYVGSVAGRIAAADARTGLPRWNVGQGAAGPVFPAGGSVYAVDDLGRLLRLDARDGAPIWAVELGLFTADRLTRQRDVVAHYGPLVAGGRVWVASGDGQIRVHEAADGTLVRTIPLPGGAAAAPAVAGATLYVVTGDGQLHAFR